MADGSWLLLWGLTSALVFSWCCLGKAQSNLRVAQFDMSIATMYHQLLPITYGFSVEVSIRVTSCATAKSFFSSISGLIFRSKSQPLLARVVLFHVFAKSENTSPNSGTGNSNNFQLFMQNIPISHDQTQQMHKDLYKLYAACDFGRTQEKEKLVFWVLVWQYITHTISNGKNL